VAVILCEQKFRPYKQRNHSPAQWITVCPRGRTARVSRRWKRENKEQNVKLTEILELLVSAGYFRTRIKGFSLFGKVIGGMTKCIIPLANDPSHKNREMDDYINSHPISQFQKSLPQDHDFINLPRLPDTGLARGRMLTGVLYSLCDQQGPGNLKWLRIAWGFLEGLLTAVMLNVTPVPETHRQPVAALPENIKPDPDAHGLLLPYASKDREVDTEVSALLEERYQNVDKFKLIQKEFEGLESTLMEARLKNKLSEIDKLETFRKGINKEKPKRLEQVDITRNGQSLEGTSKLIQLPAATSKTAFKAHQKSEEQLQTALKRCFRWKFSSSGSIKLLSQEAKEWIERFGMIKKVRSLLKKRVQPAVHEDNVDDHIGVKSGVQNLMGSYVQSLKREFHQLKFNEREKVRCKVEEDLQPSQYLAVNLTVHLDA
ncbi:hypothetical protein HPG69_010183, partial [Diceros bicornis minor]